MDFWKYSPVFADATILYQFQIGNFLALIFGHFFTWKLFIYITYLSPIVIIYRRDYQMYVSSKNNPEIIIRSK